jgi:putative transposase
MFCTMLKYEAEMSRTIYQEVDRFFPSSKTCHVCLNQVSSLPRDVTFWTCGKYQTKHDRDINAAINLRDEGLRILQLRSVQVLTSGRGDKACCPDVSQSKGGREKFTTALFTAQEAYTDLTVQCR